MTDQWYYSVQPYSERFHGKHTFEKLPTSNLVPQVSTLNTTGSGCQCFKHNALFFSEKMNFL